MAEKEQFMVSVDPNVRDRLDALRIVMGVSRAEVNRQALVQGGLAGLEGANHPRLNRLYVLAQAIGERSWEAYVRKLAQYGRQRMPTLEQLEQRRSVALSRYHAEHPMTPAELAADEASLPSEDVVTA
jgi:hypothetical protein